MKRSRIVPAVLAAAVLSASPGILRAQCGGCGLPSIAAPQALVASPSSTGYSQYPAVGDFNEDGIPDLVLLGNGLRFFPGTLSGQFGPPQDQAILLYSSGPAVAGDFDEDGHLDLVGLSPFNGLNFLHGNGDGTFSLPALTTTNTGSQMAAGDFNHDGHLDVVLMLANEVAILLGNGHGGFSPPVVVPAGANLQALAVGDFNGDGATDLATLSESTVNEMAIVLGSASGSFGPATLLPLTGAPYGVAAADFDGDGHLDLAVSLSPAYNTSALQIWKGSGTGGFAPAVSKSTQVQGAVFAGDFNGDGINDAVVVGSNGLAFFAGYGWGDFVSPAEGTAAVNPQTIAVSDVNGDGILDVVAGWGGGYGVSILPGGPGGPLVPWSSAPFSYYYSGQVVFASGDLNGDGALDILTAAFNSYSILLGDGHGHFQPGPAFNFFDTAGAAVIHDLDGDGRQDLAIATSYSNKIALFSGFGDGTFGPERDIPVSATVSALAVADINGDGLPDLVAIQYSTNTLQVFLGTGGGNFASPSSFAVAAGPGRLAVADLNGDGKLDVVTTANSYALCVLLGDGQGGFSSVRLIPGPAAYGLQLAEITGDGKMDAVLLTSTGTYPYTNLVNVLPGDGSGGFGSPASTPFPGTSSPMDLLAVDLNGDGNNDVVVFGGSAGGTGVLVNSAGTLTAPRLFGVNALTGVVTDADGDGKPDLVVMEASGYNENLAVLLNTRCAPRRLTVASAPAACATPGSALAATVAVTDDGGNVVACSAGTVTASILPGSGTPGAVLSGTTSANLVSGQAAFSNLAISTAGRAYRLRFAIPFFGSVLSPTVSIAAAPAISGPTAVCAGLGGSWSAPAGYASYLWNLDGTNIGASQVVSLSGVAAGPHTLTVDAVQFGCSVSASLPLQSNAALSAVTISPGAPVSVCSSGSAAVVTAADAGGGAVAHTWGFRTVSGGAVTVIPGASAASYRVAAADLPGPGTYFLVATGTPACGSPIVSNELTVTVTSAVAPGAPSLTAPTTAPVGSAGLIASAAGGAGNGFDWTLTGGTLTSGAGTAQITFDAGPPGTRMIVEVTQTDATCTSAAARQAVQVDFLDVPPTHPFHAFVDRVARYGVSTGCGGGNFCPSDTVTRAQMAVFLLRSKDGEFYAPPPATGAAFVDVPNGSFAAAWIEELSRRSITGGCGPSLFCPSAAVTRAQMAVFLLRTHDGPSYTPPPATGSVFADVPANGFAAAWIEELARRGITTGCGGGNFCPGSGTSRGQMAVFLVTTFALP